MENWQIALIIVFILMVIYRMRRELFGESINLGSDFDIRGDSDKRPAVYTSGATMRNLGTLFSATNQDIVRLF
jgi:hypothetical protein